MNKLLIPLVLAAAALTSTPAAAQDPFGGDECNEAFLFSPICEFVWVQKSWYYVQECECEVFYCNDDGEVDSYFTFTDYEECADDDPWGWW